MPIQINITAETAALQSKAAALSGLSDAAGELAAVAVAERAAELAPVDTGELRGSISHQKLGDGWAVVASAPHAAYVEYGTSKMEAQPYLRPAAQGVDGDSIAQAALARIGF
jgi:HK97 gp10 family phage protein